MADDDKSVLEYISEVDELLEASTFIGNGQVDEALGMIVKIMHKPDIPPQAASKLIVQLQSIASMCAIQASVHKNLRQAKAGSKDYQLKNLYYSLEKAISDLVAALKYLCK